jgi:hypothetical protein
MAGEVAAQQLEIESALPEVHKAAERPRSLKPTAAPSSGRATEISRQTVEGTPAPARAASRPSAPELLETPGALLTRSHLRGLGLERRAIDAVFRALPVVALPGYSRPMIRAEEYRQLVEQHTYRDDRVRPFHA